MMYKDLSVYIHIPFCVKKCNYCDFTSAPPAAGQLEAYADALRTEMELSAAYADNFNIKTVFVGGGTPSIYDPDVMAGILDTLRNTFENRRKGSYIPEEITIECNPKTIDEYKLSAYKSAGVNRLSIGLQSADDKELKLLGRIHTYRDWQESMETARKCGYDNINTDIISGLYGQSVRSFEDTLKKTLAYSPEHISVYSLIIEENTPFYEMFNPQSMSEDELDEWEETDRLIYDMTNTVLSGHGYDRYEISNYAKKGCKCKHNMVYWNRGDYLGFGISAASLIDNVRFTNTSSLSGYIASPGESISSKEILTEDSIMSEYAFLALRMSCGISCKGFYENFGKDIHDIYGDVIKKWTACGMLKEEDGRIYCSEAGFSICNMIMAEFIRLGETPASIDGE